MHAMRYRTIGALGVAVVVAIMATSLLHAEWFASAAGHTREGRRVDCMELHRAMTTAVTVGEKDDEISHGKSEVESIQPMPVPFKLKPGQWEKTGISLTASGEPKSGTTWFGRVIFELCVQLCGNPENKWCRIGGLTVARGPPAPEYEFEMLNTQTGELFLHFKQGRLKHAIPGLGMEGDCSRGGVAHVNGFGDEPPCPGLDDITRDTLTACLPDTSPTCAQYLPPLDPAVKRMAVIFRDARDVVISEHRMRNKVYHLNVGELEPFILKRFETIVAWIHQRWVWHTTALKDISHVEFYEDLKEHPRHLIELAAFVGLNCSAEEAYDVWQRHTYPHPPGDYTTYNLSVETLELMNYTMAAILPEAMLDRYGLTPIFP